MAHRTEDSAGINTFYRSESPTRFKIKQLTDKLNSFQQTAELESQARNEAYNHRLKQLEAKISKIELTSSSKLNIIKDQIIQIEEAFYNESLSDESFDEKKSKELKIAESSIFIEIGKEEKIYKESENKIDKLIEEKIFSIKIDLGKEKKIRKETEEGQILDFSDQIIILQEAVNRESQLRDESYEDLIKIIGQEMHVCFDHLENERKNRNEAHKLYERYINSMKERIKTEIEQEVKERENTEENLIRILEETCNRIEFAIAGKY
ncbi:unnamed protein product [Blepharisma stoltei]|uniref:Uncharacterized protein n=1 Tax=Blepharisma stoltei TaxID=1481888 RepID=A0AAU9JBF1_9CILI|nr:unnamed protein product [Blepharisma stoltei]